MRFPLKRTRGGPISARAGRAIILALAAAGAGTASASAACVGQRLYMLTPQISQEAGVGMLGHVDNGTQVDPGRYQAELVVNAQMVADIQTSAAAGCAQWIHHGAGGTIVIMGNAVGSFDGKTLLTWIHADTGASENLLPAWREHREGDTGGALPFAHDRVLKKKQMRQLVEGDVIRMSGKASATGTIVNGTFTDQVQVTYSWNGPAPYIEVLMP